MAFQLVKPPVHFTSSANPPNVTTHWTAHGLTSQLAVHIQVAALTPAVALTVHGTLFRQDIRLTQTAYNQFDVQVPYGPRSNSVNGFQAGGPDSWSWDFDTTGGTVHITNAKQEVARYPTATAPQQYGAINVDGDEVRGVDIVIPAMRIGVQYKHAEGTITLAHAKFLQSITGTVNNDTFLTFAPGEVLFLGARGADGTMSEATVSYQFAMSDNATGLSIGDIAGINKKGHELLWVRYEDSEEVVADETRPIRKPKFAYVDRVYNEIAMATALGFGG